MSTQDILSAETILIVDDEIELCDMLKEYLTKQGYRTLCAHHARQALQLLGDETVAMVILDINMPGESGLDLLRSLHGQFHIPVILLTANTDVVDRIVGLELGADDYIGKPFDLRELLARIRCVFRRYHQPAEAMADQAEHLARTNQQIRFGRCLLDLDARRLFNDVGEEIPLTAMEFDLLQTFVAHPNRVLSRDSLLELAHCRGTDPFDRSIDIRITRLRRKIEVDPARPQVIKTVRGAGYMFSPRGA